MQWLAGETNPYEIILRENIIMKTMKNETHLCTYIANGALKLHEKLSAILL